MVAFAGLSSEPVLEDWRSDGSLRLLIANLPICLLAVIQLKFMSREGETSRTFSWLPSRDDWARAGGAALVASLVLAVANLWPWTWQWPPYATLRTIGAAVRGRQYGGILIWAITSALAIPLCEEILFRFGILQFIMRYTGSRPTAVATTSLLFACGHLGGTFHPDRAHSINAAWLFLFGLALGSVTLRNGGRLGSAIAAHVLRNTLELCTLGIALSRS